MTPKTGPLGDIAQAFERVAAVAVLEINSKGGVDGHTLELVVKDTQFDEALIPGLMDEMSAEGVVGVVGPVTSFEVDVAYPIAAAKKIPVISPSSTAPYLARAMDDGFLFRNVPNDNVQSRILALYLRGGGGRIQGAPTVDSAHVLYPEVADQDNGYGTELKRAFEEAFLAGDTTGARTVTPVAYPADLFDVPMGTPPLTADEKVAKAQPYIQTLADDNASWVVLVALGDHGRYFGRAWAESNLLPDLRWILTEGARNTSFTSNSDDATDRLPDAFDGVLGTAPTYPTLGDAYGEFIDAYGDQYTDAISSQVYAPNVWDGVYLLAAGLLYQKVHSGMPFGGEALRDALYEVSRGPGSVLHAGQWIDFSATIKNGSNVNYDGASGPSDFDLCGESISPYELWRLELDASTGSFAFERELLLDASDVQELTGFDPTAGTDCTGS